MQHLLALLLVFLPRLAPAVAPPFTLAPATRAQSKPQQFRARLATVPIDVAMQASIAGRGQATATLSGNTLTVEGDFADLKTPATTAHIHAGPKGIRGPAVLELMVTKAVKGTISGRFDLTPQQLDDLKNSRLYIQLHSEKAPDGNLWGWLLPQETRR
jgi:hypothetical protein